MSKNKKFEKSAESLVKISFAQKSVLVLTRRTKTLLIFVTLVSIFLTYSVMNIFLADVAYNQGDRAQSYGMTDEAISYFTEAARLNPHEPRYARELATAFAVKKEASESAHWAQIAYNLNPHNSLTLRSLVGTYKDLYEIDSSYGAQMEKLSNEIVDGQTTNPEVFYDRALVLSRLGKIEEAKKDLEKALELKSNYNEARELLESL